MTARRVFRIVLVLVALGLAAYKAGLFTPAVRTVPTDAARGPVVVQVPPGAETSIPEPAAPAATVTPVAAERDLSRDEARGGHTLARHVAKTDADLRARLARERRIPAASTYTDRAAAQQTVAAALAQQAVRVSRWAARDGGRPNLALDYAGDPGRVIGRSLARGDAATIPCHDAVVVLRWDASANDWYVLTSYPEVRRDAR